MSDYGPPPGPPPGPSGPPPGATGSHHAPAGPSDKSDQQVAYLTYAAAFLGLLGFVWGFLDWFTRDNGVGGSIDATGYETLGAASVGLLLVAGLLAGASALEKKAITLAPAAVAVAALLVTLGIFVDHPDGYDAGIGLILALITAILQAVALAAAWLMANGRLPAFGGAKPTTAPNAWQQQGPGQFGGYGSDQGPGQYGPPPGYGPPSGYGGPPPQDQGSSYGQAPSYGPPTQEPIPSYGPPPGPPTGPPSGYGPPPQPAPRPAAPQPPAEEDDASRTQVLPRFQSDPNFGPDRNSTQQGIPIFDPQSRPDERSGEQEPPNYGR